MQAMPAILAEAPWLTTSSLSLDCLAGIRLSWLRKVNIEERSRLAGVGWGQPVDYP